MNMNAMPAQKQEVEDEVLDPLQVTRRNRDLTTIIVAVVVITIVAVLSFFCALQTSSVPPNMP
jgi:hypothetical protein